MVKFLKVRVVKGGSIQYQENQIEKAFTDLEGQLNSENVKEVLSFSFNETDSEVILVSIVRIDAPSDSKSKKGGK